MVPAGPHLQYEERENFVQCEESVCSVRTATYAVGGEGVWFEEKVSSIRNVTSAIQEEKCAVPRLSDLQYEEKVN